MYQTSIWETESKKGRKQPGKWYTDIIGEPGLLASSCNYTEQMNTKKPINNLRIKKKQSKSPNFLPEPLFWCLPFRALTQVANVIQREEEAVPGCGEPCESERCVVLFEGEFGQLGGACP